MSRTATGWVLWVSLILLIPLPIPGEPWGALPVVYLLINSFGVGGLWFVIYGVLWAAVMGWVSFRYCHWSEGWEPRIRGSVMAIVILSLLILFSSIPSYRVAGDPNAPGVTFRWLYE